MDDLFNLIFVIILVVGIFKLIFEVLIPAIFHGLYLLFSSYKFSIFLAVVFMIFFLINIQKIREVIRPKIDSTNHLLENKLIDLDEYNEVDNQNR